MKKEKSTMFTNEEISISRFNDYIKQLEMIVEDLEDGTIPFEDYILNRFDSKDKMSTMIELCSDKEKLCDSFLTYLKEAKSFVAINRLMSLFDERSIRQLGFSMKKTVYSMTADKEKIKEYASTWAKMESKFRNDFSLTTRLTKYGDIDIPNSYVSIAFDYIERNDIFKCDYTVNKLLERLAKGEITGYEDYLNPTRDVKLVKPVVKSLKR